MWNAIRDCRVVMRENKGDLGETRTLDPLIKSQLLYQLSYEVKLCCPNGDARYRKS